MLFNLVFNIISDMEVCRAEWHNCSMNFIAVMPVSPSDLVIFFIKFCYVIWLIFLEYEIMCYHANWHLLLDIFDNVIYLTIHSVIQTKIILWVMRVKNRRRLFSPIGINRTSNDLSIIIVSVCLDFSDHRLFIKVA